MEEQMNTYVILREQLETIIQQYSQKEKEMTSSIEVVAEKFSETVDKMEQQHNLFINQLSGLNSLFHKYEGEVKIWNDSALNWCKES